MRTDSFKDKGKGKRRLSTVALAVVSGGRWGRKRQEIAEDDATAAEGDGAAAAEEGAGAKGSAEARTAAESQRDAPGTTWRSGRPPILKAEGWRPVSFMVEALWRVDGRYYKGRAYRYWEADGSYSVKYTVDATDHPKLKPNTVRPLFMKVSG